MRVVRQPKYSVTFGFICELSGMAGQSPTRDMSHPDLEFALGMVDPFNHEKWMRDISALRHRGDHIVITMTSGSDNYGKVGRAIRIQRK